MKPNILGQSGLSYGFSRAFSVKYYPDRNRKYEKMAGGYSKEEEEIPCISVWITGYPAHLYNIRRIQVNLDRVEEEMAGDYSEEEEGDILHIGNFI